MFTFYQMLQGLHLFQEQCLFWSLSKGKYDHTGRFLLFYVHMSLKFLIHIVHIMAMKSNKTATVMTEPYAGDKFHLMHEKNVQGGKKLQNS